MSIPPALPVEVRRADVEQALSDASHLPLTIVTAGPGWGKTTITATWARRSREDGRAVAWLALRPADDSPASFWGAVLAAVRASGAVPDSHPLRLLSAAGGMTDEVLLAVFRGLDALPAPTLLVLDDFHVITNAEVMTALTDLVSQRSNVHLVLLTRIDPSIPMHRLRLAGVLAEVGASDLAFDGDAVRRLASGAESLELSDSTLSEVLARTEGWPAGVRLATMYLARGDAEQSLEGFGGTDRSVAEYLVSEVLQRNTSDVRDFLLRTSVVEVISGPLADAIVAGGEGHARLEALVEANQFITSVNPERTVFRYHPLLRDLLLHTLQHDDPVGFREAHRAAATWYIAHRHPVRALGHAVAAEDWDLAAQAFFEASPSVVGARGVALRDHLRSVPFASLEPSAARELCAAGLEFCEGHFFAMEGHVEEVRKMLRAGDRLPPVALAFLENLACASARARGDEDSVATAAEAALEQVSHAAPGPATEGNRLIATTQYAVALLRTGDVSEARARLTVVVRDTPQGDVALMLLGARSHLAWCDLADGNLEAAMVQARSVIDDAIVRGWGSQLQLRYAYLPLAMAQMLRGEFDVADRTVAAGLAADVNGVEAWSTVALHLAHASVAVSRRRPRAASAALESARAAMRDHPVSPALADTLTRVAGEVAILTGAEDGPPILDEGAGVSSTGWATRARLALSRGTLDLAREAADRVPLDPESQHLDDLLAAIEARLCESLVAGQQRRTRQATDSMGEALVLASPQRVLRPFLVAGSDDVARILRSTPATGETVSLRDALLGRLADHGAGPVLPEPEPLLEPLTERELAVLAELPSMRTNEEIARDFYVSINTIKSHLTHLYRKLGVGNRREAVRRGRELGLIR